MENMEGRRNMEGMGNKEGMGNMEARKTPYFLYLK